MIGPRPIPTKFKRWQLMGDEAEATMLLAQDQETEEAVTELWLEDPMSFQPNVLPTGQDDSRYSVSSS